MTAYLRKILRLNKIYSSKTAPATAVDYTVMLTIITVGSSFAGREDYFKVFMPLFVVMLLLLSRRVFAMWIVKRRIQTIRRVATTSILPTMIEMSAIDTEMTDKAGGISSLQHLADGTGWKMFEAQIDVYRHTKYGSYIGEHLYYTVFEIKLLRELPNVVFDSKLTKGHQFSYQYLKSQRLSFEGNFDKTFKVYAPEHYKIDTLSFITPEVMLALQAAHEYDIELVGDRLFLYGPLLLEPAAAERMQTHGQIIAKEINDNIDTYSDSYLTGSAHRTAITRYARRLLKSPFKSAVGLGFCLAIVVGALLLHVVYGTEMFIGNAVIVGVFAGSSYAVALFKILRDNKRAADNFVSELRMHEFERKRWQTISGPHNRL